jgi:hypothetical protein
LLNGVIEYAGGTSLPKTFIASSEPAASHQTLRRQPRLTAPAPGILCPDSAGFEA